jgi:hypothetical protein
MLQKVCVSFANESGPHWTQSRNLSTALTHSLYFSLQIYCVMSIAIFSSRKQKLYMYFFMSHFHFNCVTFSRHFFLPNFLKFLCFFAFNQFLTIFSSLHILIYLSLFFPTFFSFNFSLLFFFVIFPTF